MTNEGGAHWVDHLPFLLTHVYASDRRSRRTQVTRGLFGRELRLPAQLADPAPVLELLLSPPLVGPNGLVRVLMGSGYVLVRCVLGTFYFYRKKSSNFLNSEMVIFSPLRLRLSRIIIIIIKPCFCLTALCPMPYHYHSPICWVH